MIMGFPCILTDTVKAAFCCDMKYVITNVNEGTRRRYCSVC